MNESQVLAQAGQVDAATTMLNDLSASNAPVSSTMEMLFLPNSHRVGGCRSIVRGDVPAD